MHVGYISKLFQDNQCGSIKIRNGDEAHFNKECLWDTQFDNLAEGQEVEFEIQTSYRGFMAFHIRPHVKEGSFSGK